MIEETSGEKFDRIVRTLHRKYKDKDSFHTKIESKQYSLWGYFIYSIRHLFTPSGLDAMNNHETSKLSEEHLTIEEEETILQACDWKKIIDKLQQKNSDEKIESTNTTVKEELMHAKKLFAKYKQEFILLQEQKKLIKEALQKEKKNSF